MKIPSTLPTPWPGRNLPVTPRVDRRPQPMTRLTRAQRDRRYELALALNAPAPRRGRLLDVEA